MKRNINFKQLIKGIFVFILFYYSSYLQLIPIAIFRINLKSISSSGRVLLSLFSNTLLALILIFIYRQELKKEFNSFKSNFNEDMNIGIKYWLIGLFVMMVSNLIIAFIFNGNGPTNEKLVQKMISYAPLIMVIDAGIVAPICEEIVMRKCFRNAFPNKYLFIILSGLVFGALHVVTLYTRPTDLLYIIPYSALGFSFAYIYTKTDTVFTSISMHIIHNTILVILSIIK